MQDKPIPVTLITGFLGSGKTTLLNNLIRKYKDKKFAIIENEFGEIGIDGGLIVGVKENIFELSNGCICCTLNSDFNDVVTRLLESDYQFDYLLVETTGIADPTTIINAFVSTEQVQQSFKLDSVVCLADAINLEDLIDTEPEIRKQLAVADMVLLNKIDSVSADYVAALQSVIGNINRMAVIHQVSFASVDGIDVLDTHSYTGKEIEQSTLSFRNVTVDRIRSVGQQPTVLRNQQGEHRHDISSEGFSIPGDFDLEKFSLWMQNFLYFNSNTMFRIKGIISFAGKPERYVFHAIRGSYMFEVGSAWGTEQRFSKIVFIGKNISRHDLESNLYQLLSKPF